MRTMIESSLSHRLRERNRHGLPAGMPRTARSIPTSKLSGAALLCPTQKARSYLTCYMRTFHCHGLLLPRITASTAIVFSLTVKNIPKGKRLTNIR